MAPLFINNSAISNEICQKKKNPSNPPSTNRIQIDTKHCRKIWDYYYQRTAYFVAKEINTINEFRKRFILFVRDVLFELS